MAGTLNFEPFITDLRGQVASAWPETVANGILDAEHANQIAWDDLTMPYAVILLGPAVEYPLSMDGLTVQLEVQVFYVAATAGKSVSLRGKLVGLVNALWPDDPLAYATILDVGRQDWSDSLPPNQVFLAANHAARAGMVSFTCLVQ